MANEYYLKLLKQGVDFWNEWRREHPEVKPNFKGLDFREVDPSRDYFFEAIEKGYNLDLEDVSAAWPSIVTPRRTNFSAANFSNANLQKANLSNSDLWQADLSNADLRGTDLEGADLRAAILRGATLSNANLSRANLSNTNLSGANLSNANLRGTDLDGANLGGTDFSNADLRGANLSNTDLKRALFLEANLSRADLSSADLREANLSKAILVETNLTNAILTDCLIYGIAAWDIQLKGTQQLNLTITPYNPITVDNLELAQFIYLLLNNKKIRSVIDTITSKVVLILGRFTNERKKVLEALRDGLRKRGYSPVLFDFEKPASRDFTETVSTLAHLSRFILADLTDPSSIPQELQAIVPDLEVPVQPLLLEGKREHSMFADFKKYHWVLPIYLYKDLPNLLTSLDRNIIDAAEKKVRQLEIEKAKRVEWL